MKLCSQGIKAEQMDRKHREVIPGKKKKKLMHLHTGSLVVENTSKE